MEIIDAIKEHGISVVLKSVYPKLKGINFNEVDFDVDFTNRGFPHPKAIKIGCLLLAPCLCYIDTHLN